MSYEQICIEEQQPRLHCAFNDFKLYNRKVALSLILVRGLVGFLSLLPVARLLITEVALVALELALKETLFVQTGIFFFSSASSQVMLDSLGYVLSLPLYSCVFLWRPCTFTPGGRISPTEGLTHLTWEGIGRDTRCFLSSGPRCSRSKRLARIFPPVVPL